MVLLQRDRENREEGGRLEARIIKLFIQGAGCKEIASSLQMDQEYVAAIIADYESN